jgi:2-polyprenyl-6-methoxyphenol hydroxylase-like FAD-dependent oxidoreductase
MNEMRSNYDVVIIGAGLAGLTLSRHLLLYTNKTVLLVDKRVNPPREAPQKYGESLVQCSGYYFGKVLDLQEYLLINHYLKYNLRFYWTTEGLQNGGFEDYSQSYARVISNIPTYQLDRNLLESICSRSTHRIRGASSRAARSTCKWISPRPATCIA